MLERLHGRRIEVSRLQAAAFSRLNTPDPMGLYALGSRSRIIHLFVVRVRTTLRRTRQAWQGDQSPLPYKAVLLKEDSVLGSKAKGFAGTTVAALVAAALAAGPAAAADSTIYACIDKATGHARLTSSGAKGGVPLTADSKCTSGEFATKMFWNQTGPAGCYWRYWR
jgi:hypothetical protein